MKVESAFFLKSCGELSKFPKYPHPEFAFFGRSNVGKSSLLNLLTSRKSLVKVGAKPGVTKSVNFFLINEKIVFADMPGFGYAQVSKDLRDKFSRLISDYIKARENLKLTFVLIDIRRMPDDMEKNLITKLSEKEIPIAIIVTKCDKVTKNNRAKNANLIAKELQIDKSSIFFVSSKTGEGKREILQLIGDYS